MMKSKELSLYLKGKLTPKQIRSSIYRSMQQDEEKYPNWLVTDSDIKVTVTALQFLNLLNDFLNGKINRFELFYILNAIEQSRDLIVENPAAIEILYQLAANSHKYPLGIAYIKSMIYRP